MKMLFCADVQLGAICAENLDVKSAHKWQAARSEKLADLIDKAAQNNASYIALFGRLFGQSRISESVIDVLFDAVKEDANIQVLAFLNADEYKRISYRNDIPDNIHLLCETTANTYTDDAVALRMESGTAAMQLGDNDALVIRETAEHRYIICGLTEEHGIPSFEPNGFEDANRLSCGYAVLEWADETVGQYVFTPHQTYTYESIEIRILPEDDKKEILRKINAVARSMDCDTFLRITLSGRTAFGLSVSADGLKNHLQKQIFYVEVYDHTVMDIDEESFENDISLRSEFVRLALQDGSLSENERNRLIRCGWNALNGREVTAE